MQPAEITDLARLDRDVARAHAALERWRGELAREPDARADDEPLAPFRHVAGKRAYDAVRGAEEDARGVDAPLRAALARWIAHLTQARVTRELDVAWARAAAAKEALVLLPEARRASFLEARHLAIVAPSQGEALAWLGAAAERGPSLAAIARDRTAHREEVAQRLGAPDAWSLATRVSRASLEEGAGALLVATRDVTRSFLKEARAKEGRRADPLPINALRLAVAREAGEGWPAHLGGRWLLALFPRAGDGLRIDLGPLPAPVGAASFARALARFGYALRAAGRAPSLPFALGLDPAFADAHRFAAVFGALAASDAFQRRALGNGARVAAAQVRLLSFTLLFEARVSAARLLLARAPDRYEELTSEVFGAPMPDALAGVLPLPRDDEPARALALFTSLPLARELVDRFDVDWFRNPRAATFLRARAAAPAWDDTSALDAQAAASALARAFEEALA